MKILRRLMDAGFARFEVDGVEEDVYNFLAIVESSCSVMPKGKDISCVKHGIAVTISFTICLLAMEEISWFVRKQ